MEKTAHATGVTLLHHLGTISLHLPKMGGAHEYYTWLFEAAWYWCFAV